MKGYSQQLQFIHDCGLFIISFNFTCRDFNVSLKLYDMIKFRAKLKTAQLANFLFCSDNLLFFATAVTCRRISHPLAATYGISFKMSRPHHSFEGICSYRYISVLSRHRPYFSSFNFY